MQTTAMLSQTICLSLLGPFKMEKGGAPCAFARRKTEALLAYLALHPGPQPREKIVGDLWGDASDEDARRTLRVILTDARKVLGEDAFIGDRATLGLNPAAIAETDAHQFEAICRQPTQAPPAQLEAALRLYRGELLAGLYHDWLLPRRERFHLLWLTAVLTLIAHYRTAGDYPRAIHHARALLQQEPAEEQAHQHLIFCLAANGEREAALRQVEACRAALQKQLGVDLSPETKALAASIQKRGNEAAAARLGNLPRPTTSFIGREDELNDIETRLTQTRLLTLTGPGGSGKTRLAIQSADEISFDYPGGVWWVDLTALAEPELVAQAIANTVGVKEQGSQDLLAAMARFIGEQQMLLVLDNCEHLLAACGRVVEFLLAHCPALVLLATSREPLDLPGEIVWQTPALPLPPPGSSLKALQKNEAVSLFAARARTASGHFQLGEPNMQEVADICRRLEGIPLAIELAAAQANNLDVSEIKQRLAQTLDLQLAAPHGRYATLRAAIEWSYNLLSPVQQTLFRRLAVFRGGSSLDAACIVAARYANPQECLTPGASDTLRPLPITGEIITRQVLENLARKGLVQQRRTANEMRFDLLETLREFGREKQAEAGESAAIQSAHYTYYLALAEKSEAGLWGAEQTRLGEMLAQELPNLRAALEWADSAGQPQAGSRLAANLGRFWLVRGHYAEAAAWLEHFLQQTPDDVSLARAQALYWAGDIAYRRNDPTRTRSACEASLALCERLGDLPGQARAWRGLGMAAWLGNDYAAVSHASQHSLKIYRALNDLMGCAYATNILAEAARMSKDYAAAVAYNQETLEIMRQLGDRRAEGIALLNLGLLAVEQSQAEEGRRLLREAGQIFMETGEKHHLVYVLDGLGRACHRQNRPAEAVRLYGMLHAYSAATQFQLFGPDLAEMECTLSALRATLPATAFERAWNIGAGLGVDEIMRYVVSTNST